MHYMFKHLAYGLTQFSIQAVKRGQRSSPAVYLSHFASGF